MKIYIASLYSRREEMVGYSDFLKDQGHEMTSRWVYGGEEGMSRAVAAEMDVYDVMAADCCLSFTLPLGTMYKGGGRHTELGIALALRKLCLIVGEREQIFHHLPVIEQHDTLKSAAESLAHHDMTRLMEK